MSQIPMLNSWDEKMLKSMGISPADAHNECMVRWIEERSKRCIAEESCIKNAQAYEKIREGLEAEAWKWERRCWRLAFILAIVCSWLLVMVFRP